MKEFWALVGNHTKHRRNKDYRASFWWKAYMVLAILLVAGGVGYSIRLGQFTPDILPNITPAMFFVGFAIAISSVRQEWKRRTVSWWLTLPYSRSKLLLAKLVASYIRLFHVVVWAAAAFALIALLGVILNPVVWNPAALIKVGEAVFLLLILILAASPLPITLGMMLALTIRARKPLAPIIWGVTLTVLIFATSYIDIFGHNEGTSSLLQLLQAASLPVMIGKILVMLVAAVAVFGLSSYVLTRQTEI